MLESLFKKAVWMSKNHQLAIEPETPLTNCVINIEPEAPLTDRVGDIYE